MSPPVHWRGQRQSDRLRGVRKGTKGGKLSDEKPIESEAASADDLTKTKKPNAIQLNEEELNDVSGGVKFTDILITKPVDKSSP